MVSVSEFVGGRIADNRSEPTVNRHTSVLRECEVLDRSKMDNSPGDSLSGNQSALIAHIRPPLYLPDDSAPVGGWIKRMFDVTIAATTIVLTAPIFLMVAMLIYVTMGRPILFVQQRVGFNRKLFGCFKFRTMVADANERLSRHLRHCPEAARAWAENQKLKDDPRVTWFGQILRKSSLDELPQLFNILCGEMSCIGPRPVINAELDRYGAYAGDYIKAKPGLTGMWQVNGRNATSYAYRIKCDRYYVRRWSLLLDLIILIRTVPAVLKFDETS